MSLYVKIDEWEYRKTGDVKIISPPIGAYEIALAELDSKDAPNTGFAIHRPEWMCRLIEAIGGKKGKVVSYIMQKKDSSNKLNMSIKELTEATGVSQRTVMDTINILRDGDMIRTRTCNIMLNPGVEHRGDRQREALLMRLYTERKENGSGIAGENAEES